ncbi:hypothetical protein ASG22_11280 [Chryseobacterium sp. Leaf405]|uniref:hypothetical protein n=1 Tax=Chryseobacterium sp. Leaf405 TaxID=1736367 RepID=UPI0006F92DEA|nr:hypothetical protein [Chryseobacterium sp. Leaf405]KQT24571.1 hypothetical protein ASG22_11280 [Chryseobacterium sp. Leaf405]
MIDNKSDFPVEIEFNQKKVGIEVNQKKTINEKTRLKEISILYKNEKKLERNIPLFLNPKESLLISLVKDTIKFKGDKEALHDYYQHGFGFLTLKIGEYQNYYQKGNTKGFINTSEMYLGEVLKKAERLNNSPLGREDIGYKEFERLIKQRWFFTVFMSFGGAKLGNVEKDLMLYYYEKYFEKDIEKYQCDTWVEYNILERYAIHQKTLGFNLPKYEIIENSDEDEVNQYLPAKCQEEYFKSSYSFWVQKKDLVRAEKYKKILTEKFHAKL